jgi:hypothetical protein
LTLKELPLWVACPGWVDQDPSPWQVLSFTLPSWTDPGSDPNDSPFTLPQAGMSCSITFLRPHLPLVTDFSISQHFLLLFFFLTNDGTEMPFVIFSLYKSKVK